MLSKEKIHKAAQEHKKLFGEQGTISKPRPAADFTIGATWASEQYQGIINAVEEFLNNHGRHTSVTEFMKTVQNLKEALAKLK